MQLTKDYLHTLFEYKDGNLIYKISSGSKKKGSLVNTQHSSGYIRCKINKKQYLAHRIIYMMHHGYMPDIVDHIDGNKSNNKITNLRPATKSQNQQNCKIYTTSSTGIKGVRWNNKHKKYVVRVQANNKRYTWYVEDLELAELVAMEARDKYHKQFSNHGVQ